MIAFKVILNNNGDRDLTNTTLLTRLKHWLIRQVRRILTYQSRVKERGGWVYQNERKLMFLFLSCLAALFATFIYQPYLPKPIFTFLILAFIFIPFTLSTIFVVAFLKLTGKRGWILVATFATIFILWFLIRWHLGWI